MKRKILFILLVAVLSLSTVFGVCSFASDGATSATAESAEAPKAEFFGAALVLDNAIKIRYMVNPENVADNNDLVLLVWTEAQDEYTLGSESYKLDYEGKTMSYNGKVYPVFDFNGVGAKRLADDFYAVVAVKTETGYTYSAPCKYGVLQYAYNKLGKTGTATGNEALKILIKEMLEYGAASQNYLAYKTDRLASDDFYQVKVAGGSLSDGFNSGLYLEGEKVAVKAAESNTADEKFSHWADDSGNVVSTEATFTYTVGNKNVILTPVFKPDGYTVNFLDFDGSLIKSEDVEDGKSATAPEAPKRDGYEFVGWDKDFSNITADTTVTAQYQIVDNQVCINYVDNGDGTTTAKFSINGNVNIAMLELQMNIEMKNATYSEYKILSSGASADANYVDGVFYYSFMSANDVTADTDLFSIIFNNEAEGIEIAFEILDSYVSDGSFTNITSATVVGKTYKS